MTELCKGCYKVATNYILRVYCLGLLTYLRDVFQACSYADRLGPVGQGLDIFQIVLRYQLKLMPCTTHLHVNNHHSNSHC